MIFLHKLLQMFNMSRTTVSVDIETVRFTVDHIRIGSQRIKHTLCDRRRTAVGTVETNLFLLKRSGRDGDQVTDITVSSCRKILGTTDMFAFCERQLLHLTVQIFFNSNDHALLQLLTIAVHDLDSVVIKRVVAGGDHNTAVKILRADHMGYARSCRYMEQEYICTGCSQTGNQRILKHIAGTSRIFSDNHSAALFLWILSVIPAEITADLVCMFHSQIHICLTAESICTEIFSHFSPP